MKDNLDNIKGVLELLSEKVLSWYEIAVKSIPNIVVALVVMIIFLIFSKIIRKVTENLSARLVKNRALTNLLSTISSIVVLAIGLFISLEILHLEKTVTSILAGAGVLGLALGFAFQEIASNFVSGILIAVRKPYQLDDIVEVEDYFGRVKAINLRTTSIMTFQGVEVLIPNKFMFTQPFINYTTTSDRRLDVSVGVSYSDDLDKVEKITKKCLEGIDGRVESKEVDVFFEEFGSSSINLSARVWVYYPDNKNFLKCKHQLIKSIKRAYDENGISIPFPIRTLDVGESILSKFK